MATNNDRGWDDPNDEFDPPMGYCEDCDDGRGYALHDPEDMCELCGKCIHTVGELTDNICHGCTMFRNRI
jgi:hypothetical protein